MKTSHCCLRNTVKTVFREKRSKDITPLAATCVVSDYKSAILILITLYVMCLFSA